MLTTDAAPVLGPAPGLVAAMAQCRLGRIEQARKTLDKAVAAFDWSRTTDSEASVWMFHVLRREARAMLPPQPEAAAGEISR